MLLLLCYIISYQRRNNDWTLLSCWPVWKRTHIYVNETWQMLLFSLWIWKKTKHSGSSGVDRRDISHKIIFYYIFPVQVSKKVKFWIYTCVCVVVFNYHLIILVLSTFEGGMSSSSREVNTRVFFEKTM